MTPSPILLDDSELLRAASTPRVRLFPALYRASAFAPLIIVCCVFPAFQLLTNPTLDEEDAIWGIRAIAVSNATTLREILEPGVNDPSQPMIFQPPLAAWLNGATIRVLGPLHPLSTSLISLLATAVSIWLTSRLAWRIGGAQTALVSALLMCCHPQTLKLAISPSHGSITLCLMIASVFGFQRHLEGKWVGVSPSLLIIHDTIALRTSRTESAIRKSNGICQSRGTRSVFAKSNYFKINVFSRGNGLVT